MENATRERWQALAKQAATEQDPEKLFALVSEITKLMIADRPSNVTPDEPQQSR